MTDDPRIAEAARLFNAREFFACHDLLEEVWIETVGPELSGVLIDICCFLKGLEQVEMERGWPVRSAKIVLKTALAALARHYEPQPSNQGRASTPQTLHWGAPDYRPIIGRR